MREIMAAVFAGRLLCTEGHDLIAIPFTFPFVESFVNAMRNAARRAAKGPQALWG